MPDPSPVFWLQQALALETAPAGCPPLAGATRADVCIVGGGYTGLWTALEIKRLACDADVVVLDAGGCGFGASGRNGGWATSWYDELHTLIDRFGREQGLWLAAASSAAVRALGELCLEHEIDGFRQFGSLTVATTDGQWPVLLPAMAACTENGLGGLVSRLDGADVLASTGSPVARGGVLVADSAAVQPALLARGLRRVALDAGVRIFEGSRMVSFSRGRSPAVVTDRGRVDCAQVVLATNAWLGTHAPELRRTFVVVGTQIVLTEPLGDRIAPGPWRDGMLFGDARMFVHYAQVTPGGQIAFGRGGGALGPGGRVLAAHFRDPRATAEVSADFARWFPRLSDARITHAWSGAVDRSPGHLPWVGTLGDHETVHYTAGYSGNGVAPSNLLGRILARRALGVHDELSTCALVSDPPAYLPPEPLRTLGGMLVRDAVRRAEQREEAGRPPGLVGRAAKRLTTFSMPR